LPRVVIRFLVDEDAPVSVSEFLQARGHEVQHVTLLSSLRGTPDHVLAAIGNQQGAVLVTWNYRDFKRITSRRSKGAEKLRKLHVISFKKAPHSWGRTRLEQLIELIEFEYEHQSRKSDLRVFMQINKDSVQILR
jgi:hypothetical protein